MPEIEGIEEYEKNTKEQYAALGRFVESFETMVYYARDGAFNLLLDGFVREPNLGYQQARLIGIPLFHQSLAAKPTFEIFRAILMEKITDQKYRKVYDISDDQIKIYSGALGAISGEYEWLANKRNDLLHGTWFIGYTDSNDPHSTKFHVSRHRTTAEGMKKLVMPETAQELDALSERCEETTSWIAAVQSCVPPSKASLRVEDCFRRVPNEKFWERIWPSQHRFPSKP